ncbi:hypothetical protein Pyn_06420 [Prunus yedoensis var. nudiflora]|uniref:Protein NRT1/ PTR FAMILY 5.5 n=1 Tax=Prunus yedoensis var. nudiflora TaxID=2094558 RepID=A0A314Y9F2_PRUYE|nr:hypothetical protein Pyn_06420 [Prunus yedoensis var. nudiflora]
MSSVSTFESTRWRFTKAEITILSGADIVAAYAIWTFVTYLTDVWDLSVTQAAGIFNLYYGIIKIMPLFTQYIVDAFLGNYRMLMISSYAFVAGFGALALSTPPMLGWATGTCTAYEAECIGPVQKILFYTALPLIAVGIIGQATSLVQLAHDERPQWLGPLTFTAPITWLVLSAQDQTTPESGLSSSSVMIAQLTALSRSARGQTPESNGPFVFTPGMRGLALAAVCILGYVTSWSIKYGVSALVIIMAAFSFVALSPCSYKRVKGQGVPVKWKETKTILLVTL